MTPLVLGLIGTLLGGLLTLASSWLTQRATAIREAEQWNRQVSSEDLKWNRGQQIAFVQEIRQAYIECILGLATYAAAENYFDSPNGTDESSLALLADAQKSLAKLLIFVDIKDTESSLESDIAWSFLEGRYIN